MADQQQVGTLAKIPFGDQVTAARHRLRHVDPANRKADILQFAPVDFADLADSLYIERPGILVDGRFEQLQLLRPIGGDGVENRLVTGAGAGDRDRDRGEQQAGGGGGFQYREHMGGLFSSVMDICNDDGN